MSLVVWFTGLSGSGKTTVSRLLEERLSALGIPVVRLDGDELRLRPGWQLGFTRQDRIEQTRRLGKLAAEARSEGNVCLVAAISPYAQARGEVRGDNPGFIEVYCCAEVSVLAAKDVKGLYAKALAGRVKHFTGISDPYEPPQQPEVTVRAYEETPEESMERVLGAVLSQMREAAIDPTAAS